MTEATVQQSRTIEPIAPIVGIAVVAFVAALIYGIANNAITPNTVLWSGESLPVAAIGGAIVYLVGAALRG